MNKLTNIPEYLTYDDVLLLPAYASFNRDEISLQTKLSRHITLDIPLVSSPMDTVTESKLAIAIATLGGIGIIHRNLTIHDQVEEVKKVKRENLPVGAAIGASQGFEERVHALVEAGASLICIDSAHGHTQFIIDAVKYVKQHFPKIDVMAGNVATHDGTKALIEAGADSIRVGMGPGAICTTRIVSGMGVPQLTAIVECARATKGTDVPIVADGGTKYSGDIVKAFAAGASTVMMGRLFAQCEESPGDIVEKDGQRYKTYRGMGSVGAMEKGASIKSEDEFHGKNYKDRVLVAEGVEGLVPISGAVKDIVDQMIGGIKSGMYYVGCKTIGELYEKAQFIKITHASLIESHPHNLIITNPGKNYK
ncbi:MAG: IMP dehydrogenase [Patescibacteria group bacterium]|nr:IMP dehydrogenase [Patescibacteria group bacterium]